MNLRNSLWLATIVAVSYCDAQSRPLSDPAEVARHRTLAEFSNAVPDWAQTLDCHNNKRDWSVCMNYVGVANTERFMGRTVTAPRIYADISVSAHPAEVVGAVAAVLVDVRATCKLDSPGNLLGGTFSCLVDRPFDTRALVHLKKSGTAWVVSEISVDPALMPAAQQPRR